MQYYNLKISGIKRRLPIVSLAPKVKVASVNFLGDTKLVKVASKALVEKFKKLDFDLFVGPEVKVVPLLQELSDAFGIERYIVLRKRIHGYMVLPVKSKEKPGLVMDGKDAKFIKGKKVIVVDDVVSSGKTMRVVDEITKKTGGIIVAHAAVFKQGEATDMEKDFIYIEELPVLDS
jgi:adenine phosphoribosyltransferase